MKRLSSTIKANKGRYNNIKEEARIRNRAKTGGKLDDSKQKVLSWDAISAKSVLSYGDFNPDKFALDPNGKIITVDNNVDVVIEQTLESENMKMIVRRLDDTIVYTVDGKGNSLTSEASLEIESGQLQLDLCPDEPVMINMRTADGDSDAYTSIHPSGEISIHAAAGAVLAEDAPTTATTIKIDDDVTEQNFETTYLKIRCRKDDDYILQYAVEGKRQSAPIPAGVYTELNPGSLGKNFTPLATGPIVVIRTEDDLAGAYVEFNKDGSAKLTIPVETNFRFAEDKTTCTYINSVKEGTVEQSITGTLGTVTIRKSNNTLIFDCKTIAGTLAPNSQMSLVIDGGIDPELRPDEEVAMELPVVSMASGTLAATYGAFLLFSTAGGVVIKNETSNNLTFVVDSCATKTHINRKDNEADIQTQNLECPEIEMELRRDGNNVTASVLTKTIAPFTGTRHLFPDGTVDYAFCPEKEEKLVVELPTGFHLQKDAYTVITPTGAVDLVSEGTQIDQALSSQVYVNMNEQDSIIADHSLLGDLISLNARKQGSMLFFTISPLVAQILANTEEFPKWSIPKELCPTAPIYIDLPLAPDSPSAVPSRVLIRPDGSVGVTSGSGLAITYESVAESIREDDPMVSYEDKTGTNLSIRAKRCDDSLVFEVKAIRPNVAEGVTQEVTSANPFSSSFRPKDETILFVPSAGDVEGDSFCTIHVDGTVDFDCDGQALLTEGAITQMDIVADDNDTYVETDTYTAQADETGKPYLGDRKTVGALQDVAKLVFKKFGDVTQLGLIGCNRTLLTGRHQLLPAGTIHPRYCPSQGDEITRDMLTRDNPQKPLLLGRSASVTICHDGSAFIVSRGKPLADLRSATSHVYELSSELVEQEIDLTDKLDATAGVEGLGDWLKATFRKIKDTVAVFLTGQGKISVPFEIAGNVINAEFQPDKGFRVDINPGKDKGHGNIEIGTDGKVNFEIAAGGVTLNGGKTFTLPFMKLGNGDIFDDGTQQALKGQLRTHVLHGEGHMYYYDYHISEHGQQIIMTHTRREFVYVDGFFGNLFSQACSFLKSNVDIRGLGSKLLSGAGTFVTSLVSGQGVKSAVTGAFREVASGGISSFLRPDSPVASAIGTLTGSGGGAAPGKGLLGGVMQMLPNGAANIINKGADFLGKRLPFATSWINKAKSALFGGEQYMLLEQNQQPRNEQKLEEIVSSGNKFIFKATRYGMNVCYHFFPEGPTARLAEDSTVLIGGTLKESLRPDKDILNYITPNVLIGIDTQGKVTVRAFKEEIFGGGAYSIYTTKEYRPYGWQFGRLEEEPVKKAKKISNKKK